MTTPTEAALEAARKLLDGAYGLEPEGRPAWTEIHTHDVEALRTALAAVDAERREGGEAKDPRIFWSFSSDEEHFMGDFDTREEAIAAAPGELGLQPGDPFWVGKGSHYTVDDVDVDNLFERMAEQAVEECGEVAEDWGPVPDEECEREVYEAVMCCLKRQKDAPGFWMVGEISKHTTPDDAKETQP